jgi:hypothetical protein
MNFETVTDLDDVRVTFELRRSATNICKKGMVWPQFNDPKSGGAVVGQKGSLIMANTANGFAAEEEGQDRLQEQSSMAGVEKENEWKELERVGKSKGADITSEDMKSLMYPNDMDDESLLIPVNGCGGRSIPPATRNS